MDIIHFTLGTADHLDSHQATAARFLPLAEGSGNVHLSCLHLEENGTITAPSTNHAAALLVVRGRITVTTFHTPMRIDILGGMGCLLAKDEPYSLTSDRGAILLIVESDQLIAHEPGANCGARWPGDNVT